MAAKQNRDVGSSFGSTGKHLALKEPETEASKAFLAASEARAKDLEQTRAKATELLKKVGRDGQKPSKTSSASLQMVHVI